VRRAAPAAETHVDLRRPSSSSSPSASTSTSFPLSDAAVVEVVPTRTLRSGAVVPAFIEAPLRAKPPDHEYLSPGEAAVEEALRLQLYADIADRLFAALLPLERRVVAHRVAAGHVEERQML